MIILASHKAPEAAHTLRDIGCWFLLLPPYSPGFSPIEINQGLPRTHGVRPLIFAKVRTLLRKAAA